MGKRGPKRTEIDVLEKRGSWLAARRKKDARARPLVMPSIPKPPVPRNIKPICEKGIPGYNPWAGAKGYKFEPKRAKAAIRFFHEELTHVKGEMARHPFKLERWQQALIGNLFGWIDPKTGRRRYRFAFIFVPRKNGKTPLAAGIVLYMLFEDGEPGAEIYGAANEYKQASLVFEHARGMVLQNEELRGRCKIYSGQAKSIQLEDDPSFPTYRVIASEGLNAHGFNTHGAVIDELHTQADGELVDVLETSIGARAQPLIVYITTSDYEREGSVCNEKQEYAKKVRDGIIDDPTFLPVIYEASREDAWDSPKVWARVNPNLGVSVSRDYITAACRKAKELPRFENEFKRLHLNIRTEQDVRWIPLDVWRQCVGHVDAEELKGQHCFGGLDLAVSKDLNALVLLFPGENERAKLLPFFWAPREGARQRQQRDRVPYMDWAAQGFIRLTEGDVADYGVIRRDINDLANVYGIREIAVDRLFQGVQLCTELGQDGHEVVAFGQGFYSMAGPTAQFERLLLAGKVEHGDNPVMNWMASNVAVETDPAGNIKPSKKKSAERIDGIVAAIMALGRAQANEGPTRSVYEKRGIRLL